MMTAERDTQLNDVFLMNPDNRWFLQGKTQRPVLRVKYHLLFLFLLILFGLGLIAWTTHDWAFWNTLNQSGVPGTGRIVNKHIDGSGEDESHNLTYAYTHNGIAYTHRQSVDEDTYQNAEIGAAVDILYLPGDPDMVSLVENFETPFLRTTFCLYWSIAMWVLFIGALVSRSRDSLLAREGQMVRGEVTSSYGSTGEDDNFHLRIKYAFRSPGNGRFITGTAITQRNDLSENTLPPPGTPLIIVYRRDAHHKPL